MSTTQAPDSVLEDVAQLFAEQAGNLFSKSVFSVRDKVQAVPDAEEHRFERCQELFRYGVQSLAGGSGWASSGIC